MTHPTENNGHPTEQRPSRHPLDQAPQPPQQRAAQPRKRPERLIRLPQRVEKPYATYTLLAINVVIFIVGLFSGPAREWLLINGVNIPEVTTQGEPWRLVTSMFLHANTAHIAFNGFALFYLGQLLESLFGRSRFLLIYFLGGLGGSVLGTLMNEGGLGASGAVFALWAAELLYLYRNQELYGAWGKSRMQQSLLYMGLNFAFGIFVNLTAGPGDTRIGNFAHLGGLIGGAILTYTIGPRLHVPEQTPEVVEGIKIYEAEDRNANFNGWLPWLGIYVAGLVVLFFIAAQVIASL